VLVVGIVALHTALFHVLMQRVEGRSHSWITGLYWTLSTMTTLAWGHRIHERHRKTLHAVVLFSGIVLFLVLLPFTFIRYLYAPWIGTRKVPARMTDMSS